MDTFTFRRDLPGTSIVVIAQYIPRLETWGVHVKVNGELVEHRQTDDPWRDARAAIDTELIAYA
jgi:hypothetical protein